MRAFNHNNNNNNIVEIDDDVSGSTRNIINNAHSNAPRVAVVDADYIMYRVQYSIITATI